jgi:hypothetical protein
VHAVHLDTTRGQRRQLGRQALGPGRPLADFDSGGGLRHLELRYPTGEAWQISAVGAKDFVSPEGIRACPALELLRHLP